MYHSFVEVAIFFPRFLLYAFFSFLLFYGGLGIRGLAMGFWGWGFQLIGWVWGLWYGAFWGFWVWGSTYNLRGINLGKKIASERFPLNVIPLKMQGCIRVVSTFYSTLM